MSNKKIVIDKCLGCPKSHIFRNANITDNKLRAWCGLLVKMIPEQVLLGHKIWSKCKLQDNNDRERIL
jgi:hypothetical protein